MAHSKQRDLAQIVGKRIEVEPVKRLELGMRGATGAYEIRVVGVRKAVRVGTGRRQHGLLLECEDEVDGPGRNKDIGNRLGSLCVGGRVGTSLLDVELAAEACPECGEEARSVDFRRSDLEVWISRPAQRPRTEQRTA
jgi:hypothetical protein